jgi:hypothetical protein
MNRNTLTLAAAAVALTAAGCGSSGGSTNERAATTNARNTAASTSTPRELLGQWTRRVTRADIARTQKKRSELGPNQEKPKPQTALLTFDAKALTTRDPKATFVVQHDYRATPDGKLAILGYQHPDIGAFCGPEVPQNATYAWKLAGTKLIVRAVADPCADRDSTLAGSWTRK